MVFTHDFVDSLVVPVFALVAKLFRYSLVAIVGGFDEDSFDFSFGWSIILFLLAFVVPAIFRQTACLKEPRDFYIRMALFVGSNILSTLGRLYFTTAKTFSKKSFWVVNLVMTYSYCRIFLSLSDSSLFVSKTPWSYPLI